MKFTRELLHRKNQKGIAIVMAVFCVVLISYIVTEVTYETNIEYAIHAKSINRVKAYYAARAGIELSLLRIKIYKKIQKQFGKQLGSNAGMLNLIWSFPLNWPPVLPDGTNSVEKDLVEDKVKESKMDATFTATIFDEGSKIDINDLDSPSKVMREMTKKQLLRLFEGRRENDPEWAKEHQDFRAEELVNNIIDWLDADRASLNGGDERAQYKDLKDIETYPPNRSFRTVEELRLVAGMTDELFNMLAPLVTVYGAKAINPNSASRDLIKSLDPSITDEIVTEVMKRRDDPAAGGFYQSAEDFWGYINQKGGRVSKEVMDETPLIFDAVTNFRIQSIGDSKNVMREIDVIAFDLSQAATATADRIKKEAQEASGARGSATPTPTPGPGRTAPANQTSSKGPPRIVYWYEK